MTAEQIDGAGADDTAAITFVLVCAALAFRIYFFLQAVLPLNHDGCMYLGAARAVVAGQSPIGDVSAFVPARSHRIPEYMYPPTLAIMLTPLAALSTRAADVTWLTIVAASCGLLAFLLSRWVGLLPAALLTLGFVPTWDTFWLGQINGVIACLVALALVAAEDRKERAAGAFLAVGDVLASDSAAGPWNTLAAGGQSSGTTTALETYDVTDGAGRYVRIVGHGNTLNAWNSVAEAQIWSVP